MRKISPFPTWKYYVQYVETTKIYKFIELFRCKIKMFDLKKIFFLTYDSSLTCYNIKILFAIFVEIFNNRRKLHLHLQKVRISNFTQIYSFFFFFLQSSRNAVCQVSSWQVPQNYESLFTFISLVSETMPLKFPNQHWSYWHSFRDIRDIEVKTLNYIL